MLLVLPQRRHQRRRAFRLTLPLCRQRLPTGIPLDRALLQQPQQGVGKLELQLLLVIEQRREQGHLLLQGLAHHHPGLIVQGQETLPALETA
ncbi:hypothetical protein D3C71_1381070 [compost metagenome]